VVHIILQNDLFPDEITIHAILQMQTMFFCTIFQFPNVYTTTQYFLQGASRETDVFEMDVKEQVEGVEAWVGGNYTRQAHAISVDIMPQ
jgi:hypothetical protein